MLFWDDFSADGELGPEPEQRSAVGALCLNRTIAPGAHADFTFLLAWHFPNRTPRRCGWTAPKGDEDTLHRQPLHHALPRCLGRRRVRRRQPRGAGKEDAPLRRRAARIHRARAPSRTPPCANLSTLVTPVCFRTADGEFHGFEGANDHAGCCHGSCTHVWNYETATAAPVPDASPARCAPPVSATTWTTPARCTSARTCRTRSRSGASPPPTARWARSCTPTSTGRSPATREWLRGIWPRVKKAHRVRLDSRRLGCRPRRRDGRRAAQHLRRRVLRAESACAASTTSARCAPARRWRAPRAIPASAAEYRRLFENGSKWIDANLFNGEYYIAAGPRRRQGQDRRHRCSATWAPRIPRSRSTRWAPAACSINWSASTWRTSPASARWCRPPTSARRWSPSTATTTSARSPGTTPCSAPMRSTTRPRW